MNPLEATAERKIAKLTGTVEMDLALERMLQAVNNGFSGGRVSKHDLLSWIVVEFERDDFPQSIDQIRKDHFDQLVYLEAVLRDAKKARKKGEEATDLQAALKALLPAAPARKSAKA